MVIVSFDATFDKIMSKLEKSPLKDKVKKSMIKIIDNPMVGKPMTHNRKASREVYIKPFRLSYIYNIEKDEIIFADLYHKDNQ